MIANYVFDSLPADAFAVRDGVLEECLVEVGEAFELRYTRRPTTPEHYGDPDLDALLEHYRTNLGDTVFTIPRVALDALRQLRDAAGDRLLVLAADKAFSTEEALAYREAPQPARHSGAFSLMVNFHALGLYTSARRRRLPARRRPPRGDRRRRVRLRGRAGRPSAAYADARALRPRRPRDADARASSASPTASPSPSSSPCCGSAAGTRPRCTRVLGPLREQAADADPATQEDLREALLEIDERHFPIPGEPDLPFAIGLLLYELQDYEDAIAYFEASLEQHGHDPATEKNIELCEAMLD